MCFVVVTKIEEDKQSYLMEYKVIIHYFDTLCDSVVLYRFILIIHLSTRPNLLKRRQLFSKEKCMLVCMFIILFTIYLFG